jgi:hypothetical protein
MDLLERDDQLKSLSAALARAASTGWRRERHHHRSLYFRLGAAPLHDLSDRSFDLFGLKQVWRDQQTFAHDGYIAGRTPFVTVVRRRQSSVEAAQLLGCPAHARSICCCRVPSG